MALKVSIGGLILKYNSEPKIGKLIQDILVKKKPKKGEVDIQEKEDADTSADETEKAD